MADFTKEDFEEARREYKSGAQYTGILERIDRIVLAALSLAAKASAEPQPDSAVGMDERSWKAGFHAGCVLTEATAEPVVGWKLVPVEPTAAMLAALFVLPDMGPGGQIIRHSVDKLPDAYRAMLAAAPPSPSLEEKPEPVTISPSDPSVIIAGIRQFGLAADGSDLRDLEAALRSARATARREALEEAARIAEDDYIASAGHRIASVIRSRAEQAKQEEG